MLLNVAEDDFAAAATKPDDDGGDDGGDDISGAAPLMAEGETEESGTVAAVPVVGDSGSSKKVQISAWLQMHPSAPDGQYCALSACMYFAPPFFF